MTAFVVPRAGLQASPAELVASTRDRLAHCRCPTSGSLVDDLPRGATGKVLENVLRERWAPADPGR